MHTSLGFDDTKKNENNTSGPVLLRKKSYKNNIYNIYRRADDNKLVTHLAIKEKDATVSFTLDITPQ